MALILESVANLHCECDALEESKDHVEIDAEARTVMSHAVAFGVKVRLLFGERISVIIAFLVHIIM